MSDSSNPYGPIVKTYNGNGDALLYMPIDQLRELVYEHFRPGEPGMEVAVKLLLCVVDFLMRGALDSNGVHQPASELAKRRAMRRAVELIELVESLDGLGPVRPKGDA